MLSGEGLSEWRHSLELALRQGCEIEGRNWRGSPVDLLSLVEEGRLGLLHVRSLLKSKLVVLLDWLSSLLGERLLFEFGGFKGLFDGQSLIFTLLFTLLYLQTKQLV
jgi:hypothetical protein